MARGPLKENKKVNLVIKVEDTGIGIRPEYLNKIFETFEQIDEIIPKEGGSGLGLDITKKIIEKMGGKISVESQYEKGTVFTVELFDLSLALHSSDSKTGDFEEFDYTFYGDTILIADDFEFNLNLIEAYLSPLNLKLEKVKNGLDLIKSAVEIRPSLIITDIKMPSLDGHMAAKKLSQITKTQKIPLIGVSAVQEKESMLNEFDSFLEKPIERSILIKEVAKYLKHKKENVGKNIKDLFLLNEKIEEKDMVLLLKMKVMFEEMLELQEITELEKNCLRLIKEIEQGSLRSLKEWFDALVLELSTFQIDLVNDHLRDAISKINEGVKADLS
jgi:CheY-like chemotaxis protein